MLKILLLSYGCEPNRGSEAGIGWHWATGLAREHEVYVLTHPRGRHAIQEAMAADPNPRLHFRFVELPAPLDPWRLLKGELLIQQRYILWQFAAYLEARKLVREVDFDVVHHVSWSAMTAPTFGWALGLPFVWGPVGGGQMAPLQMRRFLGIKGWTKEAIRNVQVGTVGWNPLARLAARRSRFALAANPETYAALRRLGASCVRLQTDSAVDGHWLVNEPAERPPNDRPVIAWVSRLMARKAPGLAVEAFARMRAERPAELWMIGDGPLLAETKRLAERLGVADDVRFLGWQPYDTIPRILEQADLFLFTSLRDTGVIPIMEAMTCGLAAVALDLHGVAMLPDDALAKVPVENPDQLVDDLAAVLLGLVKSPEQRARLRQAGWECVRRDHLWSHRYEAMGELYRQVLGEPLDSTAGVEVVHGRAAG